MFAEFDAVRHLPAFLAQRDLAGVARQAVIIRTMKAGEAFQFVQCVQLFERFGIQFDRGVGGVDAGAAAGGFLGVLRVRRAVGAEKEFRVAAGGRLAPVPRDAFRASAPAGNSSADGVPPLNSALRLYSR